MQNIFRIWIGLGVLLLAAQAPAQDYTIVSGTLTDAESGGSESLTGGLQLEPFDLFADGAFASARIFDFELQAGDQIFQPGLPPEYAGLTATGFLQRVSAIDLDESGRAVFYLRSGGEIVAANDEEVTFRFFDFMATSASFDPAVSLRADGALPRRFELSGTVFQVDQTFSIEDDVPESLAVEVIGADGASTTINVDVEDLLNIFQSFDVSEGDTAEFVAPDLGSAVVSRVIGGSISTIEGNLVAPVDAGVYLVNPAGVSFNGQTLIVTSGPPPLPTLEELQIRAPDGAEITIDDDGTLTVETSGDLYLDGPIPEIPGVVGIRLVAGQSVIVGDDFDAGGSVTAVDGAIITAGEYGDVITSVDGGEIDPPIGVTVFTGLRPVFPAEKIEIGTFSLIASSAEQVVEIDVLPGKKHNHLHLGSNQAIRVVLFGSDEQAVSEIDRRSLRLGPGEGEPIWRFGRPVVFRRVDVNRDGRPDLFAVFKLSELGIAYGDTEVCLTAETHSGATLEGCDAIDTLHQWRRWRWGRDKYKSLGRALGRAR